MAYDFGSIGEFRAALNDLVQSTSAPTSSNPRPSTRSASSFASEGRTRRPRRSRRGARRNMAYKVKDPETGVEYTVDSVEELRALREELGLGRQKRRRRRETRQEERVEREADDLSDLADMAADYEPAPDARRQRRQRRGGGRKKGTAKKKEQTTDPWLIAGRSIGGWRVVVPLVGGKEAADGIKANRPSGVGSYQALFSVLGVSSAQISAAVQAMYEAGVADDRKTQMAKPGKQAQAEARSIFTEVTGISFGAGLARRNAWYGRF